MLSVILDDQEEFRVKRYSWRNGIFSQPASFSATINVLSPRNFAPLAARFPARSTRYELRYGEVTIQDGVLDGFSRDGGANGTSITVNGRSSLAWLVDSAVTEKASFSELTYRGLTESVIKKSGLEDWLIERFGGFLLESGNEANRRAITGSRSVKSLSPPDTESVQTLVETADPRGKVVKNELRAQVNTTWWSFLVQQYRRVGLFLWSGLGGKLVLSVPDAEQIPLFRLFRNGSDSNILDDSFSYNTAGRHSECIVYGRSGGGAAGTTGTEGRFVDAELAALLNPSDPNPELGGKHRLVKVIRDTKVTSARHAANLARREIAEERRANWRLTYTLQGDAVSELGTARFVVPAPDTVCEVEDEYLGLSGRLYTEGVEVDASEASTVMRLTMQRPDDIFFRAEEPATPRTTRLRPSGANPPGAVLTNGIGTLESRFTVAPGLTDDWQPPNADPLAFIGEDNRVGERDILAGPAFGRGG